MKFCRIIENNMSFNVQNFNFYIECIFNPSDESSLDLESNNARLAKIEWRMKAIWA